MTREEIERKQKAISEQRCALNDEYQQLEKEKQKIIIAAGANYVGKTLKRKARNGTEYAMLVSAPFERWKIMTGREFNEFQIPAVTFALDGNFKPLEYDFIFTGILPPIEGVKRGTTCELEEHWDWCEKAEFDSALSTLFDGVKEMLDNPTKYADELHFLVAYD